MGPNDLMNSLFNDEVKFPELGPGISLPSDCADLIRHMLDKDPVTRITIAQALEHPYLRGSLMILPTRTDSKIENKDADPTQMFANLFKKIITRKMVDLEMMKKQEDDPMA